MANAHIVTTNHKKGFEAYDESFSSQTVTANGTSTVLANTDSFAYITAVGGALYIAASTDGSANAASDPRLYIGSGAVAKLTYSSNTTIDVIDA